MNDINRRLKAYFKLIRSLKALPNASTHLFDHLIKSIFLYGCEIWAPVERKYKNPTRPLTEKASFTQDFIIYLVITLSIIVIHFHMRDSEFVRNISVVLY